MELAPNGIILTPEEAEEIRYFIDYSLDRSWDHHTDHYICTDSTEAGKRRMNPEMYDLSQKLQQLIYQS